MSHEKTTVPAWMQQLQDGSAIFNMRMGGPINRQQKTELAEDGPDGLPVDGDYMQAQFRAISARYLGKRGYYLDFSEPGVVQSSVKAFLPASAGGERLDHLKLVYNHQNDIDAIIAPVVAAEFGEGNARLPSAGINVTVKLDTKMHPKIARGLASDPPLYDNVSISFRGKYRKSHPKLKDFQFFEQLGEEVDGETVRLIVEEILEVRHLGLVDSGADEHAKKLQRSDANKSNQTEEDDMEKFELSTAQVDKLQQALSLGELSTGDELLEAVETMQQVLADKDAELKTAEAEARKAQDDLGSLLKSRRDSVKALATKTGQPDAVKSAIDKMDLSELAAMESDLQKTFDAAFPLACKACGSKNLDRRSSRDEMPQQKQSGVKPRSEREENYKVG